MKKIISICFALFLCFISINTVYADDEYKEEPISENTYDFEPTGLKRHSSNGSTSAWTREVSTAIGLYVKKGTVPNITKYDGVYNGVSYHVLEVDTSDGNTQIQVDYAGNTPKYLNNFIDTNMTNNGYYWAGAINAGFFTASKSSSMYGYPTGAVRKNGSWEKYFVTNNNEYWDCSPSYGSGFVSAYMNKQNNELELIYNGWKNGVFYKYYNDPSPNSWEYGNLNKYSEGVSGAFTLMVNGDTSIHWGKGDYKGTDFWSYTGSAITLFGQKTNGHYILLTTSGESLSANGCIDLMNKLGCVNGIRFDGGGSSQLAYDNGLYVKSISAPESATISSCDEIKVIVNDGNNKKHTVSLTDIASNFIQEKTNDNNYDYTLKAQTIVGEIAIKIKNKTSLEATFSKGYLLVGEDINNAKNSLKSLYLLNGDSKEEVNLNDVSIEVTGDTNEVGFIDLKLTYNGISKNYQMMVIENDKDYFKESDEISSLTLSKNIYTKDEPLSFSLMVNGEKQNITNVNVEGIDTSTTGLQEGSANYTYYLLDYDTNGLLNGLIKKEIIITKLQAYVEGVKGIVISSKDEYNFGSDFTDVSASFIQDFIDSNANEKDIKIDTSNIIPTTEGEYEIIATYKPKAKISKSYEKISYEKNAQEQTLNYDWQLGVKYPIGKDEPPKEIGSATFKSLDSYLKGTYTTKKDGNNYYLVGGVDNSEYIREDSNSDVAYTYRFEPYYWSSNENDKSWFVSDNSDPEWLKYIFGTNTSKAWKFTGHKDESNTRQNDWAVIKTPYVRKVDTIVEEQEIIADFEIKATKTIKIVSPVKKYTVNFYDFDNNLLESKTVNQNEGVSSSLIPEKVGYKFVSWDKDLSNVTADLDVYPSFVCDEGYQNINGACVYKEVHRVTINFDGNTSDEGYMESVTFEETFVVPDSEFTKEGYTFIGWNSDSNGQGFSYNPNDILKADEIDTDSITLYAIWKENEAPETFTVNFYDFNKELLESFVVNKGESVTSTLTPTKEGYIFKTWDKDTSNINSNLSVYPLFDCSEGYDLINNACVLHQEPIKEYAIHFNNNGGEGEMVNGKFQVGESYIIPQAEFTKYGYTFVNWNESSDGSGKSYEVGEEIFSLEKDSITLYAIWKERKLDLSPSSKDIEFSAYIQSSYEWEIPATLNLVNGQENDFVIKVLDNTLLFNQKLVISTDSDILNLVSSEGNVNIARFNETSFELDSGITGQKTLKITPEWTAVAGVYKGKATFTADIKKMR